MDSSSTPRKDRGSTTAQIVREADMLRTGYEAFPINVAADQISLDTQAEFQPQESVKIRLCNQVQRLDRETRGTVRSVEPSSGGLRLTVELFTRLTPLDVQLLKMGIRDAEDTTERWL